MFDVVLEALVLAAAERLRELRKRALSGRAFALFGVVLLLPLVCRLVVVLVTDVDAVVVAAGVCDWPPKMPNRLKRAFGAVAVVEAVDWTAGALGGARAPWTEDWLPESLVADELLSPVRAALWRSSGESELEVSVSVRSAFPFALVSGSALAV